MPANAMYDPYAAERNAMNPAALRRIVGAPTVDARVNELFGMQPGMDRLNFLPRYDSRQGWIAPNALYQVARALVSPGVAAQGGNVSPEDAVNFGGVVGSGGIGASALMRNPAPGPGKTVAATVYHGSPHNFDAFDISKIGTGEGAQMYGHGLYFADSPEVAQAYRINTTQDGNRRPIYSSVFSSGGKEVPAADAVAADIAQMMQEFGVNPKTKDGAEWLSRELGARGAPFETKKKVLAYLNAGVNREQVQGRLYTADIPDQHIANMLDWDKPLSQQPESVRKAITADGMFVEKDGKFYHRAIHPSREVKTGADLYNKLVGPKEMFDKEGWGRQAANASEILRSKGIPGIKYLDGGSRGAGEGTRNYVVFDDKLLKILSKE